MNFYEHTLVAKQDLSVAQIDEVKNKYNDIINNTSGKVMKIESWGFLNFARKINNYNKGFYIHYKFEGNNKTLDEIKKNILIDDAVLRHLILKVESLIWIKSTLKKRF